MSQTIYHIFFLTRSIRLGGPSLKLIIYWIVTNAFLKQDPHIWDQLPFWKKRSDKLEHSIHMEKNGTNSKNILQDIR